MENYSANYGNVMQAHYKTEPAAMDNYAAGYGNVMQASSYGNVMHAAGTYPGRPVAYAGDYIRSGPLVPEALKTAPPGHYHPANNLTNNVTNPSMFSEQHHAQHQEEEEVEEEELLMVQLVVPDEAVPGSKLQYTAPDGQELRLSVPEGVPPGSVMTLIQDPATKAWRCEAEPPDSDDEGEGGPSPVTTTGTPASTVSGQPVGSVVPTPPLVPAQQYSAPHAAAPSPMVGSRLIPTGAHPTTVTHVSRQVVGHGAPMAVNLSYVPPSGPLRSGASYTPPPVAVMGQPQRASYTPPPAAFAQPQRASYAPPPAALAGRLSCGSYQPPPMAFAQQSHASYTPPPVPMLALGQTPSYTPPPVALLAQGGPSYAPPPMAVLAHGGPSYTPPPVMGLAQGGPSYTPPPMGVVAQGGPSYTPAPQSVVCSSGTAPGVAQYASVAAASQAPSITALPSGQVVGGGARPYAVMPPQHGSHVAAPMHGATAPMHGATAPIGQFAVDLAPIQLPQWPLITPQIGIPHGAFGGSAFGGFGMTGPVAGLGGMAQAPTHMQPGMPMQGTSMHGMPVHMAYGPPHGGFLPPQQHHQA